MELLAMLQAMVEKEGSDLYLATGAPPTVRVHGQLQPIASDALPSGRVNEIAFSVMNESQRADFARKPEMNLALSKPGLGRFRVNIFKQRHELSMVIRAIKTDIPGFNTLGLPAVLTRLVMQKRGLILFVGGTGSGKSTSLAALIDHRNANSAGHIITIEDPIEFVHRHKRSIINQREVGVDTDSYQDALENTLRQAPDVILIGEIRSRETMEHALAFSETGHLCLSTLHANNANQALDRIINFFPEERHNQLLLDLSLNLVAIISQRLIPTKDSTRIAAVEVLLGTPRARDLVRKGDIASLKELMEKSENQGMNTFDGALLALWRAGKITAEEALKNADSANNVRVKMTLDTRANTASAEPKAAEASTAAPSKSALEGWSLTPLEEEDKF